MSNFAEMRADKDSLQDAARGYVLDAYAKAAGARALRRFDSKIVEKTRGSMERGLAFGRSVRGYAESLDSALSFPFPGSCLPEEDLASLRRVIAHLLKMHDVLTKLVKKEIALRNPLLTGMVERLDTLRGGLCKLLGVVEETRAVGIVSDVASRVTMLRDRRLPTSSPGYDNLAEKVLGQHEQRESEDVDAWSKSLADVND